MDGVCLSVCLYVCLSVCLSVSLCVCLCASDRFSACPCAQLQSEVVAVQLQKDSATAAAEAKRREAEAALRRETALHAKLRTSLHCAQWRHAEELKHAYVSTRQCSVITTSVLSDHHSDHHVSAQ